MKRRLLALLLACLTLLALPACGQKETEEEEPDRYGGIRYIPQFYTLDAAAYEIQSGCVAGDCMYLTGSVVTNEDYHDRSARLLRVSLEDGEVEELPGCLPPSEDRNVIASTEGIAVAPGEGDSLWVLDSVGRWYYDFPEDFDPYDMSNGTRGEYYLSSESFYVLRRLDRDGNELSRQEWPKRELEERLGLKRDDFISSAFLSAGGGVTFWIRSNQDLLVTMDKTGAPLGRLTKEDQNQYWQGAVRLGDGRLAMWGSCQENGAFRTGLYALSPKGDAVEESWTLPDSSTVYGGDANTLFYYNEGQELLAWKEPDSEGGEAAEHTPLLSWVNTGLDSGQRLVSEFLPDGRLAVLTGGGRFNEDETVELAVLTPTDDPPEKTVLTLGTAWLLSDMEAAIRNFNRTNENYRIEVREYMDYGAGEDYQDALNRLATEVGAGRVPDILDTGGMPLYGWASSGVLEDLWPWIDLDRDIDREDLMLRVLEADSIGGKLYEISNDFSFATVVGLKDTVGDRIAWTAEDMNAALADMPEGCLSFPYNRDRMLREMLQMFWNRFVDWEKGTCGFDSEEFREVLTFCGQFPAEGMPYEEQGDMIRERELMLQTWYPGSFWDMQEIQSNFRGAMSFVGLPNPWGAVGSGFSVNSGLAMSSAGKHKEGAWAFLRTMLLPREYSVSPFVSRFPVNKAAFEEMAAEDINGGSSGRRYGYSDSSGKFQPYRKAKQEECDQIMALYEAVDSVYRWDGSLGEIIMEIAGAYFAGDKTVDEAAELIQNRAQLYLDEQR